MSVFAVGTIIYLLIGGGFAAWFLRDIFLAKKRILSGGTSNSDKRVINLRIWAVVPLIIMLWWVALILFVLSGPDEEDPQSNVPPQYR